MIVKTLKFLRHDVDAILRIETGTTTRLFDEKHIANGDHVYFIDKETGFCFAEVEVTHMEEKSFKEIADQSPDPKKLNSDYQNFYRRTIEDDTPAKIIQYHVLAKFPRV